MNFNFSILPQHSSDQKFYSLKVTLSDKWTIHFGIDAQKRDNCFGNPFPVQNGSRALDLGFRISDFGFRISGLGPRASGSSIRLSYQALNSSKYRTVHDNSKITMRVKSLSFLRHALMKVGDKRFSHLQANFTTWVDR